MTPTWITSAMAGASAEEMWCIFPWAEVMDACAHDPIHHAEGSPWVHTTMVAAALEDRPEFQALAADRKAVVRLAAWLHDIGKPSTTIFEPCELTGFMRVRQPGHASVGAKMAFQAMMDAGVDRGLAQDVHALVSWHMRPTHLAELSVDKILARVQRYSAECGSGSFGELMALSRADQDGRIALDGRNKHLPLDDLEQMIRGLEVETGLTFLPWSSRQTLIHGVEP